MTIKILLQALQASCFGQRVLHLHMYFFYKQIKVSITEHHSFNGPWLDPNSWFHQPAQRIKVANTLMSDRPKDKRTKHKNTSIDSTVASTKDDLKCSATDTFSQGHTTHRL